MHHAAKVDKGAGRRMTNNPSGVTMEAATPAGMFSKGEMGENRWKDSTIKGRNTISTPTDTIAASPTKRKTFQGIVKIHAGHPCSSHHTRRLIRQSTTWFGR